MAQLRVDVEAANARAQFEAAARSVDRLGNELVDAEIEALRLERAMDEAADEARRLREQVDRMGSAAPQALVREMLAAEQAALRARIAFRNADDEVGRLERSLESAEREADDLRRTMERIDGDTRRLGARMRRAMLGFGEGARDAARDIRRVFADGFAGLPPQAKAAAIAAGAVAATAFAAVFGAVLNGLLLTGLGAGALAAGIAVAIRDPAVRAAFAGLGEIALGELTKATAGFRQPLIDAAGAFAKAFQSSNLRSMFDGLADTIRPLTAGLLGMLRNMGPGFKQALGVGVSLLKEMAALLPGLGTSLGRAFEIMSRAQAAEGAIKGLRVAFMALGWMIEQTANAIAGLSAIFDVMTDAAGATFTWLSKVPGIGKMFEPLANWYKNFNADVSKSPELLAGSSAALGQTAAAAQSTANAIAALNNAWSSAFSAQMSADQATLQWHQSIMGLNESLKTNGATLDVTTAKGNANAQAVLAAAQAAMQGRDAAIALAGGEEASAAAVQAANEKFGAQIGQLEAVLRQAGLTQGQIDALLGSYKAMANAPDIYKKIMVRTEYQGITDPGVAMDVRLGRRAAGGPVSAGSPYIVGEKGPELIMPKHDGMVYNADETARMLSGGRGGGGGGSWAGRGTALVVGPGGDRAVAALIKRLVDTGVLRLA